MGVPFHKKCSIVFYWWRIFRFKLVLYRWRFFSCGATQYMVLCVCVWVRMLSVRPVSQDLQNCIHQTYASANLLLAMLWFDLFASCCGLESPNHFKILCYYDWRRLDWHSTQNASRSVCQWVLYSATSATRVVIFNINPVITWQDAVTYISLCLSKYNLLNQDRLHS